jgi:hypothetical protein
MNPAARPCLLTAAATLALLPCGCAESPAFDIMGSLFPAWLLCIALGAFLAVVTHGLLVRFRIRLLFPMLAYPCLAAAYTFTLWLVLF